MKCQLNKLKKKKTMFNKKCRKILENFENLVTFREIFGSLKKYL